MIYKNFEIHNIAELVYENDGGVSWLRLPSEACKTLENGYAPQASCDSTGVELRFVLIVTMRCLIRKF